MLNQKGPACRQAGFSHLLIIIAGLIILSLGFYIGITYQKSILSSAKGLIPMSEPSVSPVVKSTPSSTPKVTPRPSATPIVSPTVEPTPTARPTTSTPPANTSDSNASTFIKITSPNGGESFKEGDKVHITWSSNNLNKNGSCTVILVDEKDSESSTFVSVNTPKGFYDWKLTPEFTGHEIKAKMDCYDSGSNNYTDQSDDFFTVN